MATDYSPFNNVPIEILLKIIKNVDPKDHLPVKLVCKMFNSCALEIDTSSLTFAEAVNCHAFVEASLPRGKALACCCCTRCGLVKDRSQFSDRQATKTRADRTCVACGIRRLKYSDGCLPSVRRESRIPCYDCLRPMPLYPGWRLKSAEAAVLLRLSAGTIYCEHCLEVRLWFVNPPFPNHHLE